MRRQSRARHFFDISERRQDFFLIFFFDEKDTGRLKRTGLGGDQLFSDTGVLPELDEPKKVTSFFAKTKLNIATEVTSKTFLTEKTWVRFLKPQAIPFGLVSVH